MRLFLAVIIVLCSTLTGCGARIFQAASLSLSPVSTTLAVAATSRLALQEVLPSYVQDVSADALWTTSSSAVSVQGGRVTCIAAGQATISATYQQQHAAAAIICQGPRKLQGIQISDTMTVVRSEAPHTFHVIALYSDSTSEDVSQAATYSTDPNVGSISANGTLSCNGPGVATLNVTYQDQSVGVQFSCVMHAISSARGPLEASETFDGPFPSWTNVRRFGAVGNGQLDDTTSIQTALDFIARHPGVLYFPSGTYVISSGLHIVGAQAISLIGADPRTTKLLWNGPGGLSMLTLEGSNELNVGRISFDGNNVASTGIELRWFRTPGTDYPTRNLIHDSEISNIGTGIMNGFAGETTIDRVHFDHASYAGVMTNNWNAANINIMDSLFTDCYLGVTNLGGSGMFNVSNSIFERSVRSDMAIGNTGVFSIRSNISMDSSAFFQQLPVGAPSNVVFQNNLITNTAAIPIQFQGPGPVTMVDNTFTEMDASRPIYLGHAGATLKNALFAAGNQYASGSPYVADFMAESAFDERSQANFAPARPPLPTDIYIPPQSGRQVYEVDLHSSTEQIAALLGTAVAHRGVLHFPAGQFQITSPLRVPVGADVHIVGDGEATVLTNTGSGPVLVIPDSHTELAHLDIVGSMSTAVQLQVSDTPMSRILCDECTISGGDAVQIHGMDDATFEARASIFAGDTAIDIRGGARRQAHLGTLGRVEAFGTSSNQFQVADNGSLVIEGGWHDDGQGPSQAVLRGESRVSEIGGADNSAYAEGAVSLQGHKGVFSILGQSFTSSLEVDSASSGTVLVTSSTLFGPGAGKPMVDASSSASIVTRSVVETVVNGFPFTVTPDQGDTPHLTAGLALARTQYAQPRLERRTGSLIRMRKVVLRAAQTALDLQPATPDISTFYSFTAPDCSSEPLAKGTLQEDHDGSMLIHISSGYLQQEPGQATVSSSTSVADAFGRWIFQPLGDGTFSIANRATGQYLAPTESCTQFGISTVSPIGWSIASE